MKTIILSLEISFHILNIRNLRGCSDRLPLKRISSKFPQGLTIKVMKPFSSDGKSKHAVNSAKRLVTGKNLFKTDRSACFLLSYLSPTPRAIIKCQSNFAKWCKWWSAWSPTSREKIVRAFVRMTSVYRELNGTVRAWLKLPRLERKRDCGLSWQILMLSGGIAAPTANSFRCSGDPAPPVFCIKHWGETLVEKWRKRR